MAANGPRNYWVFLPNLEADVEHGVETVIATLRGISTGPSGNTVDLSGQCNVAFSAPPTAALLAIKRTDVDGDQLGFGSYVPAADAENVEMQMSCEGADVINNEAGAVYVLTLLVTDASAATTVSATKLRAVVGPDGGLITF